MQHEDTDLGIDGFRHLGGQLLAWPGFTMEPIEVIDVAGFTNEWVRITGLQNPSLVKGCTTYTSFLQPMLSDMRDLSRLSKELGDDREIQTLDVAQQAPGPKWTMRQWCLYWKERQPVPPPTEPHHQAGGPGAASDAARGRGSVAPVAAAGGGASSADDGGNTEMDDEADSAFVHQGDVDQFRETSAPRKGIRESNKRRLLALTCAPLPDQVETPAAAGSGAAAALKVPGPLAAADLVAHLGLAKEVAAAATGGTGSAIAAAAARPHVAVWPQGAATNFRLLPGGAISWWAMAHGRMVFLLVPPTEQSMALFASWSASGARDHGVPFLDAWGPSSPPPLPPPPLSTAAACSSSPRGAQRFLTDSLAVIGGGGGGGGSPSPSPGLPRVVRMHAAKGDVAVLPAGWPFAVVAAEDCVVVSGQMLSLHALGAALRCWELEDLLSVKQRSRFPMYKHIMWHTAVSYARALRSAAGLPMLKRQRASTSRDRGGGTALGPAAMTISHNAAPRGSGGARRLLAPQPQDSSAVSGGQGTGGPAATPGGWSTGGGGYGSGATRTGDGAATAAVVTAGGSAMGRAGTFTMTGRKRPISEQHADSPRRPSTGGGTTTAEGQAGVTGVSTFALLPPRAAVGGRTNGKGVYPSSPHCSGGTAGGGGAGASKRLRPNTGAAVRMFNQVADDDFATATSPRERLPASRPRSSSGVVVVAADGLSGPDGGGTPLAAVPTWRGSWLRGGGSVTRDTKDRPRRRVAQGRNWGFLLGEDDEEEGEGNVEGEGEGGGDSETSQGDVDQRGKQCYTTAAVGAMMVNAGAGGSGGPGPGRGRRNTYSEDEDYEYEGSDGCSEGLSHGSARAGRRERKPGGGVALRRGYSDGGSEGSTRASPGSRRFRGDVGGRGGGGGGARGRGQRAGYDAAAAAAATAEGVMGSGLRLRIAARGTTPTTEAGGKEVAVKSRAALTAEAFASFHSRGGGGGGGPPTPAGVLQLPQGPRGGRGRARRVRVYDDTDGEEQSPDDALSGGSGGGRGCGGGQAAVERRRRHGGRHGADGSGGGGGGMSSGGCAPGPSPGRVGSCGASDGGEAAALEDWMVAESEDDDHQRRRRGWLQWRRQAHAAGAGAGDVLAEEGACGALEDVWDESDSLAADPAAPGGGAPGVRRRLRRALVSDDDEDERPTVLGVMDADKPMLAVHATAATAAAATVPGAAGPPHIKIKLPLPTRSAALTPGDTTHHPSHQIDPPVPTVDAELQSRCLLTSVQLKPRPQSPAVAAPETCTITGGTQAMCGGTAVAGAWAGGSVPLPAAGHSIKLRLKLPVGTAQGPGTSSVPHPHSHSLDPLPPPSPAAAAPACKRSTVPGSAAALSGSPQGAAAAAGGLPEDLSNPPGGEGDVHGHATMGDVATVAAMRRWTVSRATGGGTAAASTLHLGIPSTAAEVEDEVIPQADGAGDDEALLDTRGGVGDEQELCNMAIDAGRTLGGASPRGFPIELAAATTQLLNNAGSAGVESLAAALLRAVNSEAATAAPRLDCAFAPLAAPAAAPGRKRGVDGTSNVLEVDVHDTAVGSGGGSWAAGTIVAASSPPTQIHWQKQQRQALASLPSPFLDTATEVSLPLPQQKQQPALHGHLSILKKLPASASTGTLSQSPTQNPHPPSVTWALSSREPSLGPPTALPFVDTWYELQQQQQQQEHDSRSTCTLLSRPHSRLAALSNEVAPGQLPAAADPGSGSALSAPSSPRRPSSLALQVAPQEPLIAQHTALALEILEAVTAVGSPAQLTHTDTSKEHSAATIGAATAAPQPLLLSAQPCVAGEGDPGHHAGLSNPHSSTQQPFQAAAGCEAAGGEAAGGHAPIIAGGGSGGGAFPFMSSAVSQSASPVSPAFGVGTSVEVGRDGSTMAAAAGVGVLPLTRVGSGGGVGPGTGASAVTVPSKRSADGAAKPAPVRAVPSRPHMVKSISDSVPDAQKALGLVPLGAHRTAQPPAAPKGSLTRMMPGRPGQQQRPPTGGLLAAAVAAKLVPQGTAQGGLLTRPLASPTTAVAFPGPGLAVRTFGGCSAAASDAAATGASPEAGTGSGLSNRPGTSQALLQQHQQLTESLAVIRGGPGGAPGNSGSGGGAAPAGRSYPSRKGSTPPPPPLPSLAASHQQIQLQAPGADADVDTVMPIQLAIRTAISGAVQRYDMPPPSTTPSSSLVAAAASALLPPSTSVALAPSVVSMLPAMPTTAGCSGGVSVAAGSAAPRVRMSLPRLLSAWEMRDLPFLISVLRRGLAESPYHDDVPFTIRDPEHVLDQLEEALTLLEHPAYTTTALLPPLISAPEGGGGSLLGLARRASEMGDGGGGASLGGGDAVGEDGFAVGAPSNGVSMGPPPPPTAARTSVAAAVGPSITTATGAPYPAARLAVDAELPSHWRQLRDRLAAQRAHSPGPGSTGLGTTFDGDTVEQTAETDPAASVGAGVAAVPGGSRHLPPRSAVRRGPVRPVSRKVAMLKKGLGL